ncbi:MAG: DUF4332 domain-containing protein [Candidatus Saccharicenans sp.]|jgi:predicted flap endonuclease-1-like 5' DNA nuclease|nr:DUF4332 domain-containing protein [Candidatus Saccharicenans sp.]MDH7493209.1 DUF4332 domain-containing protein [Candidatus Saccharicenans sp.]
MTTLKSIEGIGEVFMDKLKEAGVYNIKQLLRAGATRAGRKELAEKAGLSEAQILKWVNRADLMRIRGIGEEYGDLLEMAGVDTVVELAQRNASNLHQKLLEINEEKKLVRRVPALKMVRYWIERAKKLPRIVTY